MKNIIEIEIGTSIIEFLNELRRNGVIKSWQKVDVNNDRKFLIEFE